MNERVVQRTFNIPKDVDDKMTQLILKKVAETGDLHALSRTVIVELALREYLVLPGGEPFVSA